MVVEVLDYRVGSVDGWLVVHRWRRNERSGYTCYVYFLWWRDECEERIL